MPDLIEFTPGTASAEEWARYHAFRRTNQAEWRPDEPLVPDEIAEMRRKRVDPRQWRRWYQVVEGGEMIAELGAEGTKPESPEYPTSRHLMWAGGYVLQAHRRQGTARGWLPTVIGLMEECGATVLSCGVEDGPGHAFVRWLGAEPKMHERQNRLALADVDWDMVERWVREAEASAAGARLELYPKWVPDEQLEEYSAALNSLLNTIPFEGLDHGEIVSTPDSIRDLRERLSLAGVVNPTCLIRDADGSIVGITDTVKRPYEPGIVRQEFTGVHERARGRGFGKWLKAAMLLHVREAYPDTIWISTENAVSNAPMLGINHTLGFRLHRTYTFYQVGLETLRGAV